jgi:splicing factor 3A subunit 1
MLDPRWKEQKAKAESRYASTNISTADVANNLKRLASQRSDVFDPVTGQAISEEELARRKKAALESYEGHPEGMLPARPSQMQNIDVNEQIRQIYDKYGEKR